MKKQWSFLAALLVIPIYILAQAPNLVAYQGVARNAVGAILVSKPIGLRLSVRDLTSGGAILYRETHSSSTNSLGLFNVNIGAGTPVTGTFSAINWGSGSKFLQVEMDAGGGTAYVNMGTQQMLSVPYSLLSGALSKLPDGSAIGNTLHWGGSSWVNDNTLARIGANVGIGTTIPAAKLDVKTTSNYVSQFNGAAPMYMSLYEADIYRGYWGSYSGAAEDVDFGTGAGNTAGKLHLTVQAVPKFTLDNLGRVGIGTTTPSNLLHLNGDMFIESSVGKFILGYNTGGSQWRLGTTAAGADLRWYGYNGTTETALHYFQQNGNMGIATGVPVPIARLNVKGAGTTSSTNTFALQKSNGDTIMRVRDDGRIGIGYNGTTYGRTINLGGTGMNLYTADEEAFGGAVFPTDTSLVLWSNSNSNNYLVLQPSWGNTGVGTYTPNAKLHLNGAVLVGSNSARIATGYSVSIDGRLISEESTVLNSTSWPDYVFDEKYKLMPLDELEQRIKELKHLPNIPSAETIGQTGIHLGDMTKRLLEKIEELTLYMIELKKENKVLAERVSELEKK